jgi:hypothetical protein
MRKVVDVHLKDGDENLHFKIKQMSATQSERWTIKLLLLIGANGGKVEGGDFSALMASLANVPYERIQELLSELLACCSVVKENVEVPLNDENVDGFISSRNTLIQLRAEAFKVNDFFQTSGLPVFGESPVQADIKRRA